MEKTKTVDIQLDTIDMENLTEEDMANLNYETAQRYIQIAKYMKKYEDQDHYYHRALVYMKKAAAYDKKWKKEVRELLRKKYEARANVTVYCYNDACNILSQAKTIGDYESAQRIFEKGARYTEKHKMMPKYISEELYEEYLSCSDVSDKVAICVSEITQQKNKHKRKSFITNIVLICVLVIGLIFSKTIYARECLAVVYSMMGEYASSASSYDMVYKQTGSQKAHEKYYEKLYAEVTSQGASIEDADVRHHLRILANKNYKDSEELLIKMEQENIKSHKAGDIVGFGETEWRMISLTDDTAILMKNNSIGKKVFAKDEGQYTWETSDIRRWTNASFLEENFFDCEREIMKKVTVATEANAVSGVTGGNTTEDYVYILSMQELEAYKDVINKGKNCWWLRSPGETEGTMMFVYVDKDKTVMEAGYDAKAKQFGVRPVIQVTLN